MRPLRDVKKQAKDAPQTAKEPLENISMQEEDPEDGPGA
jgi:hypothetical protein